MEIEVIQLSEIPALSRESKWSAVKNKFAALKDGEAIRFPCTPQERNSIQSAITQTWSKQFKCKIATRYRLDEEIIYVWKLKDVE